MLEKNGRKRRSRGGQEATEVDERRVGGLQGGGGLSALSAALLYEAHITVQHLHRVSSNLSRPTSYLSLLITQGGQATRREAERIERERMTTSVLLEENNKSLLQMAGS